MHKLIDIDGVSHVAFSVDDTSIVIPKKDLIYSTFECSRLRPGQLNSVIDFRTNIPAGIGSAVSPIDSATTFWRIDWPVDATTYSGSSPDLNDRLTAVLNNLDLSDNSSADNKVIWRMADEIAEQAPEGTVLIGSALRGGKEEYKLFRTTYHTDDNPSFMYCQSDILFNSPNCFLFSGIDSLGYLQVRFSRDGIKEWQSYGRVAREQFKSYLSTQNIDQSRQEGAN